MASGPCAQGIRSVEAIIFSAWFKVAYLVLGQGGVIVMILFERRCGGGYYSPRARCFVLGLVAGFQASLTALNIKVVAESIKSDIAGDFPENFPGKSIEPVSTSRRLR